ncbi:Hypothetical protein Nlim_0475 [Candidatus Nitrosarchaeum limnium SFB1]|jgi:chemotaxis protein CheC|uniref:CheC-like protein domain-containing protein n=1 Tax=Candidatus Nitrosarchaeum limnium SFB1 TaxID=886738 RepID=F3KJ20_9ARCH|nr:Hypothetical protein Nlim_0475 [Candidatus Nitrosarchaeum limnium SFB1]
MSLRYSEIKKLKGTIDDYITEKTCHALSLLLNEPIKHKLSMFENNPNSINFHLPSNEIQMCSVRLNGKGDLHIELLYSTKLHYAIKIASKLLGTEVNEIDEMGTSALQEVANILTGSFFNALSENTGFRIDLSTPKFKEGGIQKLLLEPTKDVINITDDVVITEVLLKGTQTGIEIHMLIIQHTEHARKLLSSQIRNSLISKYTDSSDPHKIGDENLEINALLDEMKIKDRDSKTNTNIKLKKYEETK